MTRGTFLRVRHIPSVRAASARACRLGLRHARDCVLCEELRCWTTFIAAMPCGGSAGRRGPVSHAVYHPAHDPAGPCWLQAVEELLRSLVAVGRSSGSLLTGAVAAGGGRVTRALWQCGRSSWSVNLAVPDQSPAACMLHSWMCASRKRCGHILIHVRRARSVADSSR